MNFLHPWAAVAGVIAAGLPILIHWLTRPRPVRMPLSTIRFVREALRQRRAVHWLRDLLVLLLRVAAILLLALAIARPQSGDRAARSQEEASSAVRVVLLDVSQSMGATQQGVEAMERARTAAAGLLRYRPGLAANVIFAGASSRSVFEEPSTNLNALRDELQRCNVRAERIDVNQALSRAAAMLAPRSGGDGRRYELVVLSDFQRTNWAGADFSIIPPTARIRFESVASPMVPANLAILGAECHVQRSMGRSLHLAVEVGNFSPAARRVTVEANLGKKVCRLEGSCPAGGRVTLTELLDAPEEGWLTGQVRLLGVEDSLPADDVRPLVARIRPTPVYALITRQAKEQRPSSSHFLECGLVPDASLGRQAAARLVRIDPGALQRQQLVDAAMIVLDHPGKLPQESIHLLAGLMRRGRAVLYVASEDADATNLHVLASAAGRGLQMPVEFVPAPSPAARRDLALAAVARDSAPFRVFGDSLTAIVRQLRFSGGLGSRRIEGGLADDVLAAYGDGSACLMLTSADAGALAVLNADLAQSNLPKTPAFVPILEELVERMLDRGEVQRPTPCGEALVVQLPAEVETAADLKIVAPGDSGKDPCGELAEDRGGVVWQWESPDRPGAYRIQLAGQTVFAASVEVSPEESELESLAPDVLQNRLAAGRTTSFAQAGDDEGRDDAWARYLTACAFCMTASVAVLLAFKT